MLVKLVLNHLYFLKVALDSLPIIRKFFFLSFKFIFNILSDLLDLIVGNVCKLFLAVLSFKHVEHHWDKVVLHNRSCLFEGRHFLLHFVGLSPIFILVLKLLLVFYNAFIFAEKSFRFIMNKIAENLKAVPLLNWFLFEKLSNSSDPGSEFFKLRVSIGNLELSILHLHV